MRPENVEILHALKCVLGAPEAFFCELTQYIYTCKLPPSISGFRLKGSINRKTKKQAELSRK